MAIFLPTINFFIFMLELAHSSSLLALGVLPVHIGGLEQRNINISFKRNLKNGGLNFHCHYSLNYS